MQHFREGFNPHSQTLFWTTVTKKHKCNVAGDSVKLAEIGRQGTHICLGKAEPGKMGTLGGAATKDLTGM